MTTPFAYGHIRPGQDAPKIILVPTATLARPRPVERKQTPRQERDR